MQNPKRRDVDKAQRLAAEKYVGSLPPEQRASLLTELEKQERILLARQFSEEGFAAFFEYLHGSPLHREGKKWVHNIFVAQQGLKKLLQECFRGSGKSTVLTELFVTYWIGHHPETTNVIIRVNGQKAKESTAKVADRIANDYRFKEIFPHVVPVEGKWGEQSGYTVTRTDISPADWADVCRKTSRPSGATLIGYGFDSGSIQGTRANGLLIVDDIHVKENTRSARQLEDVKDFVRYQLTPIPVPGQGLEAWNFTPWVENDAYAERKDTGLYEISRSPVMEETSSSDPEAVLWPETITWPANLKPELVDRLNSINYPFKGKHWRLAWPERWNLVEIAVQYASSGHIGFAREYLLNLLATRGQTLKYEWLGWYDGDLDPSWPRFAGFDYASVSDKQKQGHRDYAACAVGCALPGGGIVLETGRFGHYTKSESLKYITTLMSIHSTMQNIKVEAIGKGEEFYNDLVLLSDVNGKPLPLTKIESHGKASKGERFEDYLAPRFETRRIWVKNYPEGKEDPFIEEFVNEWLTFPNGRYDDVIDAVYMMAVAGEGFTPSKARRSFRSSKPSDNPFVGLRI